MPPRFVTDARDLVTSHSAVCNGFLKQALSKTQKAAPFIKDAHLFQERLSAIPTIEEAARAVHIQTDLLAAAGFSAKARGHLSSVELTKALEIAIKMIASSGSDGWRTEILYRYLLTKGDSLGGSMRNTTGASAGTEFTKAILESLAKRNIKPRIMCSKTNPEKIQALAWPDRRILFDRNVPQVNKNVDVILLRCDSVYADDKTLLAKESNYVACGEIKGGIDPAGADEHWKTASSALERIRNGLKSHPAVFFAGGAIASAMAEEIFAHLNNGSLNHAANLNVSEQVTDLIEWLISL